MPIDKRPPLEIITLGDYVRDTISGFCGVVTAETRYLNGSIKYCVEAQELDNGKLIQEYWFDHHRLRVQSQKHKGGVGYASTQEPQ